MVLMASLVRGLLAAACSSSQMVLSLGGQLPTHHINIITATSMSTSITTSITTKLTCMPHPQPRQSSDRSPQCQC